MDILPFDGDAYRGILCPESEVQIDFDDENIADYIVQTFVVGIFCSVCPEECAIGGALNDDWIALNEKHEEDGLSLEELIKAFPGPFKAIEVKGWGIACGPAGETTYYVVPRDAVIQPIPRR